MIATESFADDSDVDAFVRGIRGTDKQDDEAFRRVLRRAVEHEKRCGQPAGRFLRKLGRKHGIIPATAQRWVDGTSVPHPVARPRLFRFIADYLRAAEIEYRGMRARATGATSPVLRTA